MFMKLGFPECPMVAIANGMTTKELMSDAVYWFLYKEATIELKEFASASSAWKKNNAHAYNLVFLHCPPELEEVLKTLTVYESVRGDQDSMKVLGMVCKMCHKHDDLKQGMMAYAESEHKLYTM